MRVEKDFIGEVKLDDSFPFGIHTYRAINNFAFSDKKIRKDIFLSLIRVKEAAAKANMRAGLLSEKTGNLITEACIEIAENIDGYIPDIHPHQGGAGTSTNMAANELIANIALKNSGSKFGEYDEISPLNHVNLSQSTNDTYPTAVRIALLKGLKKLHDKTELFLNELLKKEKEFAHILKIGRTELQDAMPVSLGQEFSAWAESMTRFRWRLNKAVDWIREVNISGTAVGTGINGDLYYRMFVMEELRQIVKEPLALARNLVDATQNTDQIVEVSGLVRTGSSAVKKIAFDMRLMSSGPRCGIGELILPSLQAGSSIMPGKVNPVMLEAAEQVCIQVMGNDQMVAVASSESNLELPQFLPFIAHTLLESIELLGGMLEKYAETVALIKADEDRIAELLNSAYSVATLLMPVIGYEKMALVVKRAEKEKRPVRDIILEEKLIDKEKLDELMTPEVMASPGLPLLEEK